MLKLLLVVGLGLMLRLVGVGVRDIILLMLLDMLDMLDMVVDMLDMVDMGRGELMMGELDH